MPIELELEPVEDFPQDAAPEVPQPSQGFFDASPGTCKVCGEPATSAYGRYCAEHKATHDKRRTRHGNKEGKPKAAKAKKPHTPNVNLKDDLQSSLTYVGMLWTMTGPALSPDDMALVFPEVPQEQRALIRHPGMVLSDQAETLASALAELAKKNPRIEKWLSAVSQPAGYMGIAMAVVPVVASARVWYGQVVPRVKTMVAAAEQAEQPPNVVDEVANVAG